MTMSFNIGMIVPISYQYRRKVFTKFIDPKQKEWTNKHNNIYSNHVGFIEISKCMEKHNGSPLRRQGAFCLPFNIHSREFEAMTKQMVGFFKALKAKGHFSNPIDLLHLSINIISFFIAIHQFIVPNTYKQIQSIYHENSRNFGLKMKSTSICREFFFNATHFHLVLDFAEICGL